MMDTNQCQKTFPQIMQGNNSTFKPSKMNIDAQIDNGFLQQLGTNSINSQTLNLGTNGMYGSLNTTLLNSANIVSSNNPNSNQNQNNSIISGNKAQSILGMPSGNGNTFGNLMGSINQQGNGLMNFSYQQILENGMQGLGGSSLNGQSQNITKGDNIILTNDINPSKQVFQNQFKNILGAQQNQNSLIESTQNFLRNGVSVFDSMQFDQNKNLIYPDMMKNSGNQLDNGHNFSNQKQNQMQSSQNSLNNGFNQLITNQNNPQSLMLGYDQQQQQKLLLLQQPTQQQQVKFPDSINQPNLIQLQQLRTLNNLNSNTNLNQIPGNQGKSLAKQMLNDISDVNSDSQPNEQDLFEQTINPSQNNDFLLQMREFYNKDQEKEKKEQKKDYQPTNKTDDLQMYIQNMFNNFQDTLDINIQTCKRYLDAVSSVQSSTLLINNSNSENRNLQRSGENLNKDTSSKQYMQIKENVFETWDTINICIQNKMDEIIQQLKISLEVAIWNFNMTYNFQEINNRKQKLINFAANKIFDEKYELKQSNKEIERFLDSFTQLKSTQNIQLQNQENKIKNIIDSSSEYIFRIDEEQTNQSVYIGYKHKVSKIKQGRGILITSDNCVYQGYFENDKPNGQGRIIYSSCNMYDGHFEGGLQHGLGKYQWSNGNFYDGYFEKGRRQGKGKFTWKDGRIYEGFFKNDAANGFGEFSNCISQLDKNYAKPCCFEVYRGNWKNNKMDGKGILFAGIQAEWKENQLQNIYPILSS